jgi:hypothetical protein
VARRRIDFKEEDKVRVLLWCARHCCLCGRAVGIGIEVAHLDPGRSDIDNAIPLCFDCHAAFGHYNCAHPRGRRYNLAELRARRNQVYEEYTRHLVPPVTYTISQGRRTLPDVGFTISNLGDTYPIRVKVCIKLIHGSKDYGPPLTAQTSETSPHYSGLYLWNLNPRQGVEGHFYTPPSIPTRDREPLRARVDLTLVDIYEREHSLLPTGYIKPLDSERDWYFEPVEQELKPGQGERL